MTVNAELRRIADALGLQVDWTDSDGKLQTLDSETIERLAECLGVRSRSGNAERDLRELLSTEGVPPLITADAGQLSLLPEALKSSKLLVMRSEQGTEQSVPVSAQGAFVAPCECGYYEVEAGRQLFSLAVAPERCFTPADAAGRATPRLWGLIAQVYSLRSHGDGGVGTIGAAGQLAARTGAAGADALALSPLHAASPIQHGYSPYSPSHRCYLNWLLAEPRDALGKDALKIALQQTDLTDAWQQAEQGTQIDWPTVAAMRSRVFRALHANFEQASAPLKNALKAFERRGDSSLRAHALFAARQELALRQGESLSWRDWGTEWRERGHSLPGFFASSHAQELHFEVFSQWLASRSLAAAQAQAKRSMAVGLITDVAVGFEPGGSEAWQHRDGLLRGLTLGAPPDAFNSTGQQWGITSYAPHALRRTGYRPFIELLRSNMAIGGGVRIDHILGLARLWVVPEGEAATTGAYLTYPLMDLLRLVAIESWRNQCIVIGEDLGTVPAEFRAILAKRAVLGTDVLLFNKNDKGAFLPPESWRPLSAATTTTHDLPPLESWQNGRDIEASREAVNSTDKQISDGLKARQSEVEKLRGALKTFEATQPSQPNDRFNLSAMRYVASSAASLVLIPLEDALELNQQPNVPGTIDEYPNWRQRVPDMASEQLETSMMVVDQARKQADSDA